MRNKELSAASTLFNKEIREKLDKKRKSKDQMQRMVLALKSGLEIKEGNELTRCLDDSIGGFQCNSNDVNQNTQRVAIFSSQFYGAANMDITPDTFDDAISLLAARRLIQSNWDNWKDEYMVPNKEHPIYSQWQLDSIVFNLFESKSQQTSMRNINIGGDKYDIYNEFFWLSRQTMIDLARGKIIPDIYSQEIINDLNIHAEKERYVYTRLRDATLSPDAKQVLDMATAITYGTIKYRSEFNQQHPEYHINTWDAGWYQIKALAKQYIPNELKAFNELYKQLADRMRPLVYELGFLYK